MKSYQAYAKGAGQAIADTPKQAAQKFFSMNPSKRKCNIVEGKCDGVFFVVTYGRSSQGEWPQSWKDITKKIIDTLPDTAA